MTPGPALPRKRVSQRRIAEAAATVVIALGVFMLMQPFSIDLYSWSFAVTLTGTAMFLVGSKLPG